MLPTETADGFYPPYRDLTEEERVRFAEDGVACVRDCVDPSWLAPLAGMIERQLRHPSPIAVSYTHLTLPTSG